MILRDGDERLTLNIRRDTSSYSNQPQRESNNMFNIFNDSSGDFLEDLFSTNQPSGNHTFSSHLELTFPEDKDDIFDPEGGNVLPEKLLDLDSTKDLHPPLHVNPLSGSTTYSSSSNQLLDELALITFPMKYDDDLQFDVESDLKEIEFLLHQDIDSSLKDSIDQSNLANPADIFVDFMPEMFIDEHALDYSSPLIFDEYDDGFLEAESDAKNVYDDPFDSKGEKIKESKLLIDELDLLCDFPPSEYDSFISQDFYKVDAKPSTNNKDKGENLGSDLVRCFLCPNFIEGHTAKGVRLRVADFHTSNHREDDFTSLKEKGKSDELENRIEKLEVDFGGTIKAKEAKRTKHDQLKVNKEMELDMENMTLNEYLMYEGRNRDLTRNCTFRKREARSDSYVWFVDLMVDENIDTNIAREKEEVIMEDVEMDEDHDVDHSKT
nr:hypothetical protein [Tanacetum cinerariifolium]